MQEIILEGTNLVKEFRLKKEGLFKMPRIVRALDYVNIRLPYRKTLGIVGESGSGKSTLSEILGDLQKPNEGIVEYRGKDINRMSKEEYRQFRRNVQFIFQNPKESMNPHCTIEKILMEPMNLLMKELNLHQKRKKIEEILPKVGMEPDCIHRYPNELSGGQCQRIAIARALLLNPEVIICDECVSALDVSIQAQILNLLKSLQKEFGTAYLFISHDMGVVHYMSDYVLVMVGGKIIEEGCSTQVIQNPKEEYTASLIQSANFMEESPCIVQ